jgi:DNA/RNA endonuclease YhcR with UshA esterase domain
MSRWNITKSFVGATVAAALLISGTAWALQPNSITASEAYKHIGETATVCGNVASATYATGSRGKPTFLNLDKPYPGHIFTAVVWDNNRAKFSYAPESLKGETICVSGLIEQYKGKAQIEVRDPGQIQVN